jgi:hypothetical protein
MTINFKDLNKLITLCRKNNINSITIEGTTVVFGPQVQKKVEPPMKYYNTEIPEYDGAITENTKIESNMLTADQLLFYSSESLEN